MQVTIYGIWKMILSSIQKTVSLYSRIVAIINISVSGRHKYSAAPPVDTYQVPAIIPEYTRSALLRQVVFPHCVCRSLFQFILVMIISHQRLDIPVSPTAKCSSSITPTSNAMRMDDIFEVALLIEFEVRTEMLLL